MKKALIAALVAAISITAVVGVSAAFGENHSAGAAKSKGKRGPRGFTGARGPAGPAGAAGPAGIASLKRANGPAVSQGAFGSGTEVQTSTATCPAGTYVTGGGYSSAGIENFIEFEMASPTQYSVIAVNEFNQSTTITAQAICAGGAGISAAGVRSKLPPKSVVAKVKELQAAADAKRR